MRSTQSDNLEHRIFRQAQKERKRGNTPLGSFNDIYSDYYNIYRDYLTNLLINLIEYKNAPKTLNTQGLEFMLRCFGYANVVAISKDEVYTDGIGFNTPGVNVGLGSLIGGVNGKNNTGLQAILDGQQPEVLTRENVNNAKSPVYVTIANKFSYYMGQQTSDSSLIDRTASTLAEIKASILANIRQQKTPFIGFTKNGNLTAKSIYRQLMEGNPFIQVDGDVYDGDISKVVNVFPTQAPNLMQPLADTWSEAMNEFLTLTGINNIQVDKKERLIAAEGDSNNEQVSTSLQIYLTARQQQLDLINEALGTDIKAQLNSEAIENAQVLKNSDPVDNEPVEDEGDDTDDEADEA